MKKNEIKFKKTIVFVFATLLIISLLANIFMSDRIRVLDAQTNQLIDINNELLDLTQRCVSDYQELLDFAQTLYDHTEQNCPIQIEQ